MRIGFDGRYIQDRYHGIGRYAFELLRQMIRLGQQHTYVVFWNPELPNGRFDLGALLASANVEAVPYRVPLYWPQDQVLLPIAARRLRLDMFHVPYFAAPVLLPCPFVMTIYDLIFERYPEFMPARWARAYYRAMATTSLRRTVGVLAISEATRRDLLAYYRLRPDAVEVTPLAADAIYHPAAPERIAEVRQRYGLPEDFILTVGARRPHKNVQSVVRALGLIRDRVPHSLVLVGEPDGRFPDEVPALVGRQGLAERVIEIASVPEQDLPAIYSAATVLACPSLIEGFGLPVLEAMSCGLPVVTSQCSSLPEVAGDAALLIDPTDTDALAAALLRVLSEPGLRADLRRRGLLRASHFSWEITASRTLDLYERARAKRLAPMTPVGQAN